MRKLLEIEFHDELKKSLLTLYAFSFLTFALFILTRISERSVFSFGFFVEFIFVFGVLRFYGRAHRNRNYALWGLTLVISLYLVTNILHYTFIAYNIFVLYIAFLSALFLAINTYVMSSPLYFPRIQWWEYDFRYRGDLKAAARVNDEDMEVRISDLRRDCVSTLCFGKLKLGSKISIEVPYGSKIFTVQGQIKTSREDIPGRPISYGIKLDAFTENERKTLSELKKVWDLNKKANIRRKFSDYKESQVNSEL